MSAFKTFLPLNFVFDATRLIAVANAVASEFNAFVSEPDCKSSFPAWIPISNKRAIVGKDLLWAVSKGIKAININDYFLSETQAQLQLALFGFSNKFQEKTNENIRNMFSGKKIEYIVQIVLLSKMQKFSEFYFFSF